MGFDIVERDATVRALVKAARVLIATNPAFRLRPVGGEGSIARLQQQDAIAAEDSLLGAIADVEENLK